MGRPMPVPPWAAALDPTEKLIPRPIVLGVETRGIVRTCFALLQPARPPGCMLTCLLGRLGNSKYAVLPWHAMSCSTRLDSLSVMIGLGLAPLGSSRKEYFHPIRNDSSSVCWAICSRLNAAVSVGPIPCVFCCALQAILCRVMSCQVKSCHGCLPVSLAGLRMDVLSV